MSSVLSRASLRYLAKHPAQLVLAVLGVAIGVAVVVGIETANASAKASLRRASSELSGGATHVIRGGTSGIDERVFVELALDPRAPEVAPLIERTLATWPAPATTVQLVGLDPFSEGRFRPFFDERSGLAASALLTERLAGALAAPAARRLGLAAGDGLSLIVGSRVVEVRIAAIFEPPRALADLLVLDIAAAQELLGEPGRIDRIDLAVVDEDQLAAVRERVPADCTLERADAQVEMLAGVTRSFELNLRALGFVALLVGVFLVYNTMTFSVVQRRQLWGTLRAIGATRGEIFRLIWSEALAVGIAGTALGIALGLWLARGMSELVERTVNDLYYHVTVRQLALEPRVLLEALALGIGVTLVGALTPALAATRTAPRATLDRAEPQARLRRRAGRLALAGIATCAAAVALLALPGDSVGLGFVALTVLLVGAALLVPLATVGLCRALAPLAGLVAGNLGRAAVRGVSSHLARSSVAIVALSIALAASSAMGIVVHSFRGNVVRWLSWTLTADVYLSAPSNSSNRDTQTLDPSLIARARALPGADGFNLLRDVDLRTVDGESVSVTATESDPRSHGAYRAIEQLDGDPWPAYERGESVFLAESLARRLGLHAGDEIAFASPSGPRAFVVALVFRDYSAERGWAMFSRRALEAGWNDPRVSSLGLFAAPGVAAEDLARDVLALLGPGEVARVRTRRELIELSLVIFDRTFAVTRVLRWLSGAVAFLGVAGALLALALEREREFGVLRAIGLGPRGLRGLVLGQTGVLGAIAGLLSLPLGIAIALVLILVINARSFGWTLDIDVEPRVMLETFGLAIVASLFAGIVPAWRMARGSPARVLRGD